MAEMVADQHHVESDICGARCALDILRNGFGEEHVQSEA
jgi:hypothetical protein